MDPLATLVSSYVLHDLDAALLRQEVVRHVSAATRRYPDAYFNLGAKTPEAVDDLANRVFTTCARVTKGRFPFSGRVPFRAYVEEHFNGTSIRYHTFYAQVSIMRELLRTDYEHNVVRNPRLRWRGEIYDEIGAALRELAERVPGGNTAPRWRLMGQGLAVVRRDDAVIDELRASGLRDVPGLVARALRSTGPITQSRLANLLFEVLEPVESGEIAAPAGASNDRLAPAHLTVREAVRRTWTELAARDRDLMIALARGDSYDELIARDPSFKHRPGVSAAVDRCNKVFLARLYEALGVEGKPGVPPRELLELLVEVLAEMLPELIGVNAQGGAA